MAVAVKNPPGATLSGLFDRPAVVSLLGVLYVVGALGIVFKLLPMLWWPAWDGLGLEGYQFVGGSLLGLLMLAAGVGLAVLGGQLLGRPVPLGVKGGIFVGFVGVVLVLLLTRWADSWIEHWVYADNWFGKETGAIVVAVVGVVLLIGWVVLFTRPQIQRLIVKFEEGGWFSAEAFKPTQGHKVRRGTIFGILMLAGAGIYTMVSHGTLRRGPADWALAIPFTGKEAIEKMGDTEPWVAAAAEKGAEVKVIRPALTDLPAKQNVSDKVFREKLKAALEKPELAELSPEAKKALAEAADKNVVDLLLKTNEEITAEIKRALGEVKILTPGATKRKSGEVIAQKPFREEVRGRLALWPDNVNKKVREDLNKVNHEDGLVALIEQINTQIAAEAKRLLGQVKVVAPGKTGLKENAGVGLDAYRDALREVLKSAKGDADKKALAPLAKAVDQPDLGTLLKEVNAIVAAEATRVLDGKLLPAAEATKLKASFKEWAAKKDADDAGAALAPLVTELVKAAGDKKAELPVALGLPLATLTFSPVFTSPKDVALLQADLKKVGESPANIAALVADVKRLATEKKKAPIQLSPVFDLPTATVERAPVLKSQKDVREVLEQEEKTSKTDITPLIEKYEQLVKAQKGSPLPVAFRLPTGLVVLDRYALRDINKQTSEDQNVKIGLPGNSDFKPNQIVPRSQFDAEVAQYGEKGAKEGLTPPTRLALVPASGKMTFDTLTLLPSVQFTVPLLLLVVSLWVAWRIVNIPAFADFLIATEAELNKVSWTTQRRLMQDTVVVLVTVVLMAVYLFAMDQGWRVLLSWEPVGVLVIPKSEADKKKLEQMKW